MLYSSNCGVFIIICIEDQLKFYLRVMTNGRQSSERKTTPIFFFFFSLFPLFLSSYLSCIFPLLNHFCPPFLVLFLAPHHLCPIKIQNFPQFFFLHHHPGFAACNWSFSPLPLFISPSPYVSLYTPACPMSSLTFSKHHSFCSSYQLSICLKYLIKPPSIPILLMVDLDPDMADLANSLRLSL